jgi:hypothetical protein
MSKGSAASSAEIDVTLITAAKPAVVTLSAITDLSAGDLIKISGTTLPELDGKTFVIGTVTTTGDPVGTVELKGADLTGATIPGTIPATAKATVLKKATDLLLMCLASISIDSGTPGTVSVATYCEPTASLPAIAQEAGTMTLEGWIDPTDPGYVEILAAEIDGLPRTLDIKLPGSMGDIVADITVSSVAFNLPIDGGLGFSASAVLAAKPIHRF